MVLALAAIVSLVATHPAAASLPSERRGTDEETPPGHLTASLLGSLTWRNIGPGLTSGRIADIAAVESDTDIIYVATATGGLWKTTNRGTTWKPIFENGGTASLGAVAIARSNPNVVWVGTGEAQNWRSTSWGDGVYKSEDGGKTWTHMGLEETRQTGKLVIHPDDTDVVYVAAMGVLWGSNEERGLFKTADGGKSWQKVLFISEHTGVADLAMDPRDPDVLYAAVWQRARRNWSSLNGGPEGGIFKSTDGGQHWDRLTHGLPEGEMGRVGLSICRSQPDTLYASITAKENESGLYRSDDRGASWERRSGISASRVRCDPNYPERVYLLRNGESVSEDGGKTFTRNYAGPRVHVDQQAMWIDPHDSDHLVIGTDGGVYLSQDRGRHWDFMDNIPVTQFYTVAVDLREPFYYVYGGTQDQSSYGGPSATRNVDGITNADWFRTIRGDGFYAAIDPTVVYSEAHYGRMVRFDTRTGEQHLIQPQAPEGERYRWNWSSPFLTSHYDHQTVYFAANKVFKSTNRGDAWEVSPDLTRARPLRAASPGKGLAPGLEAPPTNRRLIWVSRDDGATG